MQIECFKAPVFANKLRLIPLVIRLVPCGIRSKAELKRVSAAKKRMADPNGVFHVEHNGGFPACKPGPPRGLSEQFKGVALPVNPGLKLRDVPRGTLFLVFHGNFWPTGSQFHGLSRLLARSDNQQVGGLAASSIESSIE